MSRFEIDRRTLAPLAPLRPVPSLTGQATQREAAPVAMAAPERRAPFAAALIDPGAPPVDLDRVAALRAAMADGSYTIDPDRIAAAMIAQDHPAGAAA